MPQEFATPKDAYTDVYVRGRRLACLVCANETFLQREIKLNTTGMSFVGLDWANRSGVGAICRSCGFVHTFLDGQLDWRTPGDASKPWMAADGE
jgi:predicted nucleic-acid-binding Zn-ribbon protein